MRHLMLVALLATTMTGCLHTTFTTGKPRGNTQQSGFNHFFLWGLVNGAQTDLPEACPAGVSKFTVYKSFLDGFLELITVGIYTPRSWRADCAAGDAPAVVPAGVNEAAP